MAEKLADFKAAKKYGFGDEGLLGEGSVRDGVGHYNLVKLISPLDYPKGVFFLHMHVSKLSLTCSVPHII